MKKKITFLLMFVLSLSMVSAQGTFRFGTSATPEGKTLLVDSKGLILDGKHIIPVMGEIHYSRVPESEWRREIRKMKAGGINIISTYMGACGRGIRRRQGGADYDGGDPRVAASAIFGSGRSRAWTCAAVDAGQAGRCARPGGIHAAGRFQNSLGTAVPERRRRPEPGFIPFVLTQPPACRLPAKGAR